MYCILTYPPSRSLLILINDGIVSVRSNSLSKFDAILILGKPYELANWNVFIITNLILKKSRGA